MTMNLTRYAFCLYWWLPGFFGLFGFGTVSSESIHQLEPVWFLFNPSEHTYQSALCSFLVFILKSVFIFISLELKSLIFFLCLSFGKICTQYRTNSPGTLDFILDQSVLEMEISGLFRVVKAQKVFKFNLRFIIVCKNILNNVYYFGKTKQKRTQKFCEVSKLNRLVQPVRNQNIFLQKYKRGLALWFHNE